MPLETENIKLEANSLYLFVGPADSGKSFAASSFGLRSKKYGGTDPRPAYLMDTDGRVSALRGRPVQYDTFTNEEGSLGVINRLVELREKCYKYNEAPFHTLIAPDSFTGFCELAMGEAMDNKDKANEGKKISDRKGRFIGEMDLPTLEDYGYESEAVRKMLWENLIDIKRFCDVIVTAHEVKQYKTIKGKPGEPVKREWTGGYTILAREKLEAKVPTKFDEIYHFNPKEEIHATSSIRRSVKFQDTLARTSHPALANLTEHDISGKEFYTFWKEKIGA